MKPALEFTMQADSGTHLRVAVKVWRNQSALNMARHAAREQSKMPRDFLLADGFTHAFYRRSAHDLTIAEIHLNKANLSIETIAHEAVHAAVCLALWIRPCSKTVAGESRNTANERDCCITEHIVDEAIAYPTGYLTEGIIWNLRKNKLKIKPL